LARDSLNSRSELGVELVHIAEHALRLVELALALEVERQVVEVVEQRLGKRHLAELVPGEIELALALVGEPEHAVRLGRGLVGFELGALGDDEALRDQRGMADQQQRRGQHELQPDACGPHQREVQHQQPGKHAARDRQRRACLEPRQQHGEIGGDERDDEQFRRGRPGGHDEEMLLQDRRHRVRQGDGRRGCRRDRRHLVGADAGGGGADQHDLVGVLGRGDLAAVDIVERVDGERGLLAAVAIEIGVHLELGIGADAQRPEADAVGLDLDVARPEVEAFRGDHQRQRRKMMVEIAQHQRLGAHAAVDVRPRAEVAERRGAAPDQLDRQLHLGCRQGAEVIADFRGNGVLQEVFRQRPVGPAARKVDAEENRQQHVARLDIALRQPAIGIERLLRLLEQRDDRRHLRRRRRGEVEQLGDVDVSRIDLRLAEEHGVRDDLGFRAGQKVGHPGVDLARPGPAPDVRDARVVDGDHRQLVGRQARSRLHAEVVGLLLEARNQIARAIEGEHDQNHDRTEKPVGPPQTGFHAPPSPLFWIRTLGRIVAAKTTLRQIFTRVLESEMKSVAEDRAGLDCARGKQLRGGEFLAIAELGAQHFDAAALSADLEALVGQFDYFADLALDRTERAHRMLAGVEDLQFFFFQRGPGARRGVAAADQVVDEVDVVGPVDARLGPAAPAFIAGPGFVLHHFSMFIRND